MGNSLEFVLLLGTSLLITCGVFANLELRSPVITDWGDWHGWDDCPEDKYVVGMQLRTHEYQGLFGDDSALNGINFFCDQLGSRSDQIAIVSGQENHGSFGTKNFCDGVATGFQLRSEKSQSWIADDTAGNNLRLICNANSSNVIESDGLDFGDWTAAQECFRKQALCGYSSQIDHDLSSGDITGLNNIKMRCCDIPDPAEICVPEDNWDLLIECDNVEALTPTTCQYVRKVGISHSAAYSEGYSHLVSTYTQVGFTLDQALSALGINFGLNLGFNSSTGYDWTASTSDVWSVETTTSVTFDVPPGVRTQLFQTMGKCGIYTGDATDNASKQVEDRSARPLSEPSVQVVTQSADAFALNESGSLTDEIHGTDSWPYLSKLQKSWRIGLNTTKLLCILPTLYLFICSLDLLSVGFRIVGGHRPQKLFEQEILQNPIVGLMCGIMVTVIVQSSSTTSSAVVGMVAGNLIEVKQAIPIIIGANVGTSFTNTMIAMLQVDHRNRFRRAFAAATIHDMFNWCTTLVLLPLESLTGYLYHLSDFIVRELGHDEWRNSTKEVRILKALTDPLSKKIVKINKTVVELWSHPNSTVREIANQKSMIIKKNTLFASVSWDDTTIGILVVVGSFLTLFFCLIILVKILNSILKGKIAVWLRTTANAEIPSCPGMTDYVMILLGSVLTFLIQSSSAFTSTLPPLVAMRIVSIERAYSLTLGSNIGTTTTGIIAALAQTSNFFESLQIALCHFLFNVTGVILFFPIPCTRFPIRMAKALGNTTAEYRWFAIVYIVTFFFLIPLLFMGLAFAGTYYVLAAVIFLVTCFLFVVTINDLRRYPRFLPKVFHTWKWLPLWLRSLEPYDKMFSKFTVCRRLQKRNSMDAESAKVSNLENEENGSGENAEDALITDNPEEDTDGVPRKDAM
ncbi:unnamed protein product [Orchesella dallaii]|uniref:Sodium-dependent phosphate transport protein 2B n=1 Tax=Orchesella dallaii TaxID=48710 RepID=A0ABP1RD81_9HEXA